MEDHHQLNGQEVAPYNAYAGPAQGPCMTLEPPKTSADTGVGAKPPLGVSEPQVNGSQNRVQDPVLRVCRSCGQHLVSGSKQSRCSDCRARSERKRRASVAQPSRQLVEISSERTCARCREPFWPKGRAQRCDDCRLAADPKTSQCPYCLAVYVSHDDSRAGVAERTHHARKACIA